MTLSGILVIFNVSTKKAAKLTRKEECEEIIDSITQIKTIVLKELVKIVNHLLLYLFYLCQCP